MLTHDQRKYHPNRYLENARQLESLQQAITDRHGPDADLYEGMNSDSVDAVLETYNGMLENVYEWAESGSPIHDLSPRARWWAAVQSLPLEDGPALNLPDHFYIHLGEDAGLYLPGEPNKFIEGAYFQHMEMDDVPSSYLCTIVCDSIDFDVSQASIPEIMREQALVAHALIVVGEDFAAGFRDPVGNLIVGNAVVQTRFVGMIAHALTVVADPHMSPDVTKEIIPSVPGMRF
ncbi:hypothetical protein G6M86_17605 [Agrobacterium tumefaciens]|uniref:Uncharacterized protein n=1 Tax=Agrobacterium tumefaciens TaxID=358 RepID=A0AAJ4N4X8_AGRTU|nr:hypothetical protein G6M86_17605 [Agrobacterium tumefaciens]